MEYAVIIPAAGASRRYQEDLERGGIGGGRSKLDEDLGGRPVLLRTVELFSKRADVRAIVVAGPADEGAYEVFSLRHGDALGMQGVTLCRGGKEARWETVRNALEKLIEVVGEEWQGRVAVHDAARPCGPVEMIDRVFDAATRHAAVVPGVAVGDTLKRVGESFEDSNDDPAAAILGLSGGEKAWNVEGTVDREGLFAVQTPQVFEVGVLRRAYAQDDLSSTDDAGLVERLGEKVVLVEGDTRNMKITRGGDVEMARVVMGLGRPRERSSHHKF